MHAALIAAGIPCTVILDSAVAYVMDQVDFILVGSEAVVESGGLINAVGCNQMPPSSKVFWLMNQAKQVLCSDRTDGVNVTVVWLF